MSKISVKAFSRFLALMLLTTTALTIANSNQVLAESYKIGLGETFYYESCWKGVGNTATLERQNPKSRRWNKVAKSRPIASPECESGYKLISYEWTPKTKGKHQLRERISGRKGARDTLSKVFSLTVSSYSSPVITPPLPVITLPSSSSNVTGSTGPVSASVYLNMGWSEFGQRYSISGNIGSSSIYATSTWSEFGQRYSISGNIGSSSIYATSTWSKFGQRYSISGNIGSSSIYLNMAWSSFGQSYNVSGTIGRANVNVSMSWSRFGQSFSISGNAPPEIISVLAATTDIWA